MTIFVAVLLSNFLFWLLWIMVEMHRRRRGEVPEVPYSLLLLFITLNTLPFEQIALFRFGALATLLVAASECRSFVQRGVSELSLAGAAIAGTAGGTVLTYWAVVLINEHLNLPIS